MAKTINAATAFGNYLIKWQSKFIQIAILYQPPRRLGHNKLLKAVETKAFKKADGADS
ncbi:MAG: hypothetical protein WBB28_07795 [Crinalium sp.]